MDIHLDATFILYHPMPQDPDGVKEALNILLCESHYFPAFHRADLRAFKPAVESAVTRLLVSIKQMLESLTLWSQLRMDEEGVSNVYVQLGNDFNEAVAAFSAFNIDMTYVLSRIFSVQHPV
jgi:hypothetical protein